ncbi:S26 family signal peptidase [Simplicispira suum]|uniref:S26 family signal peptidase n=1 Tax=Simplicispira suum TaxID=2109915 RepID=A0A2S0N5R6_9BURK|nr:S26 family signal peptidase [Simplicispira suum]
MHRCALLACMGLALAGLAMPIALPLPVRVVFNPSDSVARGWYRVDALDGAGSMHGQMSGHLRPGSIVLARLPAGVATFAEQRGYLPEGVPILKRVGAVAPQTVCVVDRLVWIDGVPVAAALARDGAHRPLQPWAHCRVLAGHELFLLSDTNPASFDSRYFGPIDAVAVLGIAQPVWTW